MVKYDFLCVEYLCRKETETGFLGKMSRNQRRLSRVKSLFINVPENLEKLTSVEVANGSKGSKG